MSKFCTKCGCMLCEGGLCPSCDKELLKKQSKTDVRTSESIMGTESSAITGSKKKDNKSRKKKTLIIVCVVLVAFVICGLVWLFGSLFAGRYNAKTQDEYMIEYAEYATVDEYDSETNEFGENIAVAEVRCPDYKSIYNEVFKLLNIDDETTDAEISAEFFGEVSKQLKDDYETTTMEVTVNLSEEDYEKTENDSWSDEEVTELLKQRAAIQAFEEFCIDMIMEYAPEITEEGLLGVQNDDKKY